MVSPEETTPDVTEEVASTKEETGEKALDVIEEEDLDGELLIEDDGDFFWVLQRVIWGTVKGLILLGAIILAVWFIWGGDDQGDIGKKISVGFDELSKEEESKKIEKKSVPPKTVKKVISNIDSGVVSQYASKITKKAYELEDQRIDKTSNTIKQGIHWLKWAKALGEVSTDVLRIEDSTVRAKKIEDTIVNADKALEMSQKLQVALNLEIENLTRKKNKLDQLISEQENKIFYKISHFESNGVADLLSKKIVYQKELVAVSEEGKIRETLLKNIRGFDALLRTKRIPLVKPTEMIQGR